MGGYGGYGRGGLRICCIAIAEKAALASCRSSIKEEIDPAPLRRDLDPEAGDIGIPVVDILIAWAKRFDGSFGQLLFHERIAV